MQELLVVNVTVVCIEVNMEKVLQLSETMYSSYHSRAYNDHEKFCSHVVHEICSTHIQGFEQSELDIIICYTS